MTNVSTKIPNNEGYLRLPEVLALFPVSRSTWWGGVKTGRFPKPVKLTPRCTAWKVDDIRALLASPDRNHGEVGE